MKLENRCDLDKDLENEDYKEYADYEITDGGKVDIIKVKKFFYKKNSVY